MRDGFEYASDDRPWTPQVWAVGPDQLVQIAKQQLWQDQNDIGDALFTTDRAFSGPVGSDHNENEVSYDVAAAGEAARGAGSGEAGGTRDDWEQGFQEMHRTVPLAAWADGTHSGPANPNV